MIHRAGEVLVKDQGYAADPAETAIREGYATGTDELSGCGLMCVSGHLLSFPCCFGFEGPLASGQSGEVSSRCSAVIHLTNLDVDDLQNNAAKYRPTQSR
jgi:hypothetical protein